MVEQDHARQILFIVRILRVVAGNLELEHTAAGDLHTLEADGQAVHILRQIVLGEITRHHIRQQEGLVVQSGHSIACLFVHFEILH